MKLLYYLGVNLFLLFLRIASLFHPKAKAFFSCRKKQFRKIEQEFDRSETSIWFHCASLGEFEQGRPLIEEIRLRYPNKKIVLTFFSASGYEVRKDFELVDHVYYLPVDTPGNARRFVKLIRPEKVFFVKYEYWYYFLKRLRKMNIPVYIVSAIFRKEQLFFKRYAAWYRDWLKLPEHFFVQNEESSLLLNSIGIYNYTVTGDTRFDRVAKIVENVKPLKDVERFLNGQRAIVAGSTWKAEEALLLQYLRREPKIKVLLAPHVADADNIERLLIHFGDKAQVYSKINEVSLAEKQVLIVDCYGMLTSMYQYGYIAIVGGGFGEGIHNVLEPATYGMPIIFGPAYEKFQEAVDLVALNSAFPINNVEDFNTIMNHMLKSDETVKKVSEQTKNYVQINVGATKRILDKVF